MPHAPNPLAFVVGVLLCCAPNLRAQTAPTITTQPTNQTVPVGANVTFTVAVDGTGPFTYRWQFNGSDLPTNTFAITTVAGNGKSSGAVGDGGPATNATLRLPWALALDAATNLYIADSEQNLIRKVDHNGIITTVAGIQFASSNYGGMATDTPLYEPEGIAFDTGGNLYIADSGNNIVLKVDTNDKIYPIAGIGLLRGALGDGGPATNANLYEPTGVALDAAGNLYIGDSFNNRVRKVDTNGTITTFAGKHLSGFSGDGDEATNACLRNPSGLAIDAAGNLYIADTSNSRIRKVDAQGIITTVAGNGHNPGGGDGGEATNAGLNLPRGIAFDSAGNLYIADTGSGDIGNEGHAIRKVDTNGIITTVAGNGGGVYAGDGGPATNASLRFPSGLALDSNGNLYIADAASYRVFKVYPSEFPSLVLTNTGEGEAGSYTVIITSPYGSVTSAVATLTVTVPPQIINTDPNFGFQTSQFGFNVSLAIDQTTVVDGSTNLIDWIPLFTNSVGITQFYFFDCDSTNLPQRYYCARLP